MKIALSIVDNLNIYKKQKHISCFFFTEKKVKFFLKLLKKVIFKVLKKNLTAKKKRGMNRFMKKWWC